MHLAVIYTGRQAFSCRRGQSALSTLNHLMKHAVVELLQAPTFFLAGTKGVARSQAGVHRLKNGVHFKTHFQPQYPQ